MYEKKKIESLLARINQSIDKLIASEVCDLEHSQTFEKTVIIRVNTNGINCTSINYRLSILETVRNMSLELPHKLLTFN